MPTALSAMRAKAFDALRDAARDGVTLEVSPDVEDHFHTLLEAAERLRTLATPLHGALRDLDSAEPELVAAAHSTLRQNRDGAVRLLLAEVNDCNQAIKRAAAAGGPMVGFAITEALVRRLPAAA
jgi:hypothetical protein